MDKNNRKLKILSQCIKVNNTSAIWQHIYAAHTTNQTTHLLTITAPQKSLVFGNWKLWGKRSHENGPKAEKDKTKRATGLCRKTREQIYKSGLNLIFQAGGRHHKSPVLLNPQAADSRNSIATNNKCRQSNMLTNYRLRQKEPLIVLGSDREGVLISASAVPPPRRMSVERVQRAQTSGS